MHTPIQFPSKLLSLSLLNCPYLNAIQHRSRVERSGNHEQTLNYAVFVANLCLGTSAYLTAGARELDTQQLARTYSGSVMLIASEGSVEGASQGTGFIVSADGLLVTNYHVIQGGKRLFAKSNTGGIYAVTEVAATDAKHDIAVLQVAGKNMPFLQLGDSVTAEPGTKIAVIGNPVGLESTITEGIVSAVRSLQEVGDVIQISAAIFPGSSGSPVLNSDGKVIGIATFKLLKGDALNFAIPVKRISEAINRAKETVKAEVKPGPYSPNPLAVGSSEEDAKALQDPAFAYAKALEVKKDYFGMLNQSKVLVATYSKSALIRRLATGSYFYLNMMDDAMTAAKMALDFDPNHPRGWNNLAILHRTAGEKSKALDIYIHAINLAPDDAKLLIDYARAIGENNPKAARAALAHARQLLAENRGVDAESSAYPLSANLANALRQIGELQESYQASLEATNREPNRAENWEAHANSAMQLRRFDEVRQAVTRANDLDKNYQKQALRYAILARAEEQSGNVPAAIEAFEHAYSIRPNDSSILTGLISALCKKSPVTRKDLHSLTRYLSELRGIDSTLAGSWRTKVMETVRRKAQAGQYLAISPELQAQLDAQERFETQERRAKEQSQQKLEARRE